MTLKIFKLKENKLKKTMELKMKVIVRGSKCKEK